jgi:hypothetical protein
MRKRWLLLLLIPVAIVAVPVLLFGMLIGTRLLSMVAGPVNIFNTPGHAPSAAEIAGYYRLSKDVNRAPRGGILSERAGFSLGSDHRLEMTEMPAFDGFGESLNCDYNGTGSWSSSSDGDVQLYLSIETSTPSRPGKQTSCGATGSGGFEVLGHSRPYRIWYWIGDPDSEQGLTYELQSP